MSAISITAANVATTTSTKKLGVSGATITAGMPIYRDASASNVLKKCQANTANTATCHGIALNGASAGQPVSYLEAGSINLGATLVVGQTYCVSSAASGAIVPISDLTTADYATLLGVATAANNLTLQILSSGTAKA